MTSEHFTEYLTTTGEIIERLLYPLDQPIMALDIADTGIGTTIWNVFYPYAIPPFSGVGVVYP